MVDFRAKRRSPFRFFGFFILLFSLLSFSAQSETPLKNDAAATAHPLATDAAIEIFKKGGNAIDAAVAAAFALGVVEPENSGIGGGGFMLIYLAKTKEVVALDYREMAPVLAHSETFINLSSTVGYSASGVPGAVKGLAEALKSYGRLPLKDVTAPALRLAKEGFPVSRLLAKRFREKEPCLGQFESTRKVFFKYGQVLKEGSLLIQKDLAKTLQTISDKGPGVFYEGEIGGKIAAEMKAHGGLIGVNDLKDYKVKRRVPLRVDYRGYTLSLMPPPSSGGILLTEMFQMLSNDPLRLWGWGTPREAHLLAEVMKLAYRDRFLYLGDEDFVKIPREKLLSPAYAQEQRKKISFQKRVGEADTGSESKAMGQTTHATFVDREGNVVAMTNSLNLHFGSCVVLPGTGIVMNNHMDDFATNLQKPNAFGLMQGKANQVEPHKRPLSSMSPTVVFKEGRPVYGLGSPGGSTIPTNVFQVLINLVDHQMPMQEAIDKPKLHHQYRPDVLRYQKGYPELTLKKLQRVGHVLEESQWGNVQAVEIDWKMGEVKGFSDPRGEGKPGRFFAN